MKSLAIMFRNVFWRLRLAAGFRHASDAELRYRVLRLPERANPGRFFTLPWGPIEFVAASDLRGQYFEIFVHRHYAFRATNIDPVIIDAGGNIGMSAIWFKQEYPNAKLTVYEADPELAKVLARNLAAAKTSGVDVQNAAVWTQDGTVSFDNLGQDKGTVSASGGIQVRSIDLARHLPERVDLLKLDIEGAEYAVIERLCSTGAISRVRNLVAEFHVRRSEVDAALATLQLLRNAGMNVSFTSVLGPWLGQAETPSSFEAVQRHQSLMEVYAWR